MSSLPKPPSVNLVLNSEPLRLWKGRVSHAIVVNLIRAEIQSRSQFEESVQQAAERIAEAVSIRLDDFDLRSRKRINATGIVIHTGWGNAPLHGNAVTRMVEAAGATGTGNNNEHSRIHLSAKLLTELTGAESATVITSNAASYSLLAGALAAGRDILVAARDLFEISDGARIGDILEAAGAGVVSVGSANCVRIEDYENAIGADSAALLRVHASNTVTQGFTAHVDSGDLARLAHRSGIVFAENLGGGSLLELTDRGLPAVATLGGSLGSGADLVMASGDKVIGGPQSGIIVGRRRWIEALGKHPLARTCRPDKLILAALEATLSVYVSGNAWDEIPVLRMLSAGEDSLKVRAESLARELADLGWDAGATPGRAECGGAVLPGVELPTWCVRLRHRSWTEDELHTHLLNQGMVSRRKEATVLLDLRSVLPEDDGVLLRGLSALKPE